jgi:Phage major capsid protein E
MPVTINPFDAGGYSLAEMTEAINILPNIYTRLGQLGLFRYEGVTQRSVLIEQSEGVLNLLPTVPLGGPPTVANRDARSMRSFTIPWIPHDDVITPQDIQGVRGFGVADAADPLATMMERKLTRMRAKHAQTREYMEVNALRGVVKDGAGVTLYDYFDEFDLAQLSVDFVLGTATTNVQAKCREVLRKIETELKGEVSTGALALVSPGFFDKLIGHAKVEEAYKYYSSTGAQPLREDTRRRFPFAGIVFEEYNATVTLSTGATETLVPANEGIAFPLGTLDTFVTYGAPANLIETVNTVGLPMYARQIGRLDGSAIDVKTEASILPVNKRPRLAVKIHTSN